MGMSVFLWNCLGLDWIGQIEPVDPFERNRFVTGDSTAVKQGVCWAKLWPQAFCTLQFRSGASVCAK
jgi:hypothetical protein